MFKKTIKYVDFNGDEQEEDFYFHVSKPDMIGLAHNADAFKKRMEDLIKADNGRDILNALTEIIAMGAGKRSEDGKRFIKTDEAKSELLDSPAYEVLLTELATDAAEASKFFNALFPGKMIEEMAEMAKKNAEKNKDFVVPDPFANPGTSNQLVEKKEEPPIWEKENRRPKAAELRNLPKDQLQRAFAWAEQFDE